MHPKLEGVDLPTGVLADTNSRRSEPGAWEQGNSDLEEPNPRSGRAVSRGSGAVPNAFGLG
eukprot:2626937-Alexandrium_andersonii.AAC.1